MQSCTIQAATAGEYLLQDMHHLPEALGLTRASPLSSSQGKQHPPASQEGEELRNIPAPTQTPWPIAQSRHTTEGAQLVSRMSVWNWLVSQLNQFWFLPVKWTSLLRWNQRRINMEHPEDISIHNIPLSFSVSASLRKLQWNLFKHTQHKNNEVIAVCKEVGCN